MGGRLLDWLGSGLAADRPNPATMVPGLIPTGSTAFYFAIDLKILSIFDESGPSWFEADAAALSGLAFSTLADVDWSVPPTDGQIFKWDNASGKLVPETLPTIFSTEAIQDIVGAMMVSGAGMTVTYDDPTGTITVTCNLIQYTDEKAQDAIAAAFAAAVAHPGLTVTYDDVGNSLTLSIVEASSAEMWGGAASNRVVTPKKLKDWRTPIAVADGATITLDGSTGVNFYTTLGGSRSAANPTNFVPGQFGVWHVTQDGTGSRTLTFGSNFKFAGVSYGSNVLSTTAGATDAIHYYVRSDGTISCFIIKGLTGSPAQLKLDDLANVNMSTPPTDGQVLTYNNATSKWKPANAAGGGGGANWWLVPPTAASMTTAGTVLPILTDDADAGLLFDAGAPASGDVQRIAYRTLTTPANDWDMKIRLHAVMSAFNYSNIMVCTIMDGVGGRIQALTINNANGNIQINNFNGLSGYNSNPLDLTIRFNIPNWFRVTKVGTAINYYVSGEGKQWAAVYTTTATAFLAANPNRVGFGANYNRTSGISTLMAIEYFSLTGTAV